MRKTFVLCFVFSCVAFLCKAQSNYSWPIKGQFPLTGNYGEIRPNHFHMGLDLSTQNKENFPVLAIADGYVSRLRISSVGYGKSIYITHPDGHLSLYAHLNKFEEPLASYISKIMLEQKVNEIDFTLPENVLQVQKGQKIGLSGNTGGSSGPHLHFEIRDTKSEIPLNPLLFYNHKDELTPVLTWMAVYDLKDSLKISAPATNLYRIEKQTKDTAFVSPIECKAAIVGLGFAGYDLLEKNGNKNQIAKAELWFDTTLIYRHYFSQLQFDDARYVNEFADKSGAHMVQRCFVPEQYPSGLHDVAINRGRVIFRDTLWHRYKLRLSDESGNQKLVIGTIRATVLNGYSSLSCQKELVRAGIENTLQAGKFTLRFPAKSLYNSACIQTLHSVKAFTIASSTLNLHTAIKVSCFDTSLSAGKKVLTNGGYWAAPKLQNDSIYWEIKSTGAWQVDLDNTGPQISTNFPKGKRVLHAKQLRFFISDKKSGIATYDLYINSNWVPVYYDAKSSQLILELDDSIPKGLLQIKLLAKDKCGNTSTLQTTFNRL